MASAAGTLFRAVASFQMVLATCFWTSEDTLMLAGQGKQLTELQKCHFLHAKAHCWPSRVCMLMGSHQPVFGAGLQRRGGGVNGWAQGPEQHQPVHVCHARLILQQVPSVGREMPLKCSPAFCGCSAHVPTQQGKHKQWCCRRERADPKGGSAAGGGSIFPPCTRSKGPEQLQRGRGLASLS